MDDKALFRRFVRDLEQLAECERELQRQSLAHYHPIPGGLLECKCGDELQTKLAEKGRAFDEVLLMQGAEISALQELVAIQYRANEDMTKELQAAEAEVERLRTERAIIDNKLKDTASAREIIAVLREMGALKAEVEQLRKALEGMVNCPVGGSGQRLPTPETVARARAALDPEVKRCARSTEKTSDSPNHE